MTTIIKAKGSTPTVVTRTNISTNPNAVSATAFSPNSSATWTVTRNVAISGHPQCITTAAKATMTSGHTATAMLVSIYNLDGLLNTGPAHYLGVWVMTPDTGYQAYFPHDTARKTPLQPGVWTWIASPVQLAANTYSGLTVAKISGNVTDDTDYAYVTGVMASTAGPVTDTVWGGRPATLTASYAWTGTADASTSTESTYAAADAVVLDWALGSMLTGYDLQEASGSNIIDVPGRAKPVVVTHPMRLRTGSIEAVLADEATATTLRTLLRRNVTYTLADSDRPIYNMNFALDEGGFSLTLDSDTRSAWVATMEVVEQ